MFLGPRRVILDPFLPLGDSESKILFQFGGRGDDFLGLKFLFLFQTNFFSEPQKGPLSGCFEQAFQIKMFFRD